MRRIHHDYWWFRRALWWNTSYHFKFLLLLLWGFVVLLTNEHQRTKYDEDDQNHHPYSCFLFLHSFCQILRTFTGWRPAEYCCSDTYYVENAIHFLTDHCSWALSECFFFKFLVNYDFSLQSNPVNQDFKLLGPFSFSSLNRPCIYSQIDTSTD